MKNKGEYWKSTDGLWMYKITKTVLKEKSKTVLYYVTSFDFELNKAETRIFLEPQMMHDVKMTKKDIETFNELTREVVDYV